MSKTIRAHLQLASEKDVQDIERLDARSLSSNVDRFVSANLLNYYVLVNTWLLLIQQWSRYGWVFVLNYIKQNGLISLIREFDNAATELINGLPITFSLARTLWMDVQRMHPLDDIPQDSELSVYSDPLSAMLLILRFGKRFSPLEADLLRKESIDGFIARQRELRDIQRYQEPSRFVVSYVKEAISDLIDWRKLVKAIGDIDITDITFTPGVSFDTKADLVSKLRAVRKERVEYFPHPFGISLISHPDDARSVEYWGKHMDREVHCVRLSPVPKNYKTARIIAPEDVVRQALARTYFELCDDYLPDLIKLHDQTRNQTLAKKGSVDGSLATIDLHAASDSITPSILSTLLPHNFLEVVERILPTHYEYNGKRFRMESAATMGNSMTFWLESVVFTGISLGAVRFYNALSGDVDDTVSVYGDDIIVPVNAAATVIEWLEEFGFVVNHDKSFFSPSLLYRESCGREYLNGLDVSSRYFPRFPLIGEIGRFGDRVIRDSFRNTQVSTMGALVDLQHKMYYLCVPASQLISELIYEAEPKMTTSTPDEGFNDLWSYESKPRVVPAPATNGLIVGTGRKKHFQSVVVDGMVREAHYAPITTYPVPKEDREGEMLVNLYNYQQFLKNGPRYDTPLDRLLGVSSPGRTFREASSTGEVKWIPVK
jgi:hypothetical protein